jgi:hypothetical protein
MNHRHWYRSTQFGGPAAILIAAATLLSGGMLLQVAFAQSGATSTGATGKTPRIAPEGISLKQALEKGLKARRPSEFAYIELVVKKVEEGKLPQSMVERSFLWARRKNSAIPMPYFERSLQIMAKKIGVNLPYTDT